MPRWLASRAMGQVYTPKSENERHARRIRNSSGIAVFVSEVNDKAHWVETGRCHERFTLHATALGLGSQRPDLVVRFGHGRAMPLSVRRPVQAVIV